MNWIIKNTNLIFEKSTSAVTDHRVMVEKDVGQQADT